MSVIIAAEGEFDLENIANFIAVHSAARAVRFVQDLVAQCQALAEQPLRHPIVTGYGHHLRRFPYRGYSNYYQVKGADQVFIVHVLNDATDHRRFFEH